MVMARSGRFSEGNSEVQVTAPNPYVSAETGPDFEAIRADPVEGLPFASAHELDVGARSVHPSESQLLPRRLDVAK
jgi:hypothetical protein